MTPYDAMVEALKKQERIDRIKDAIFATVFSVLLLLIVFCAIKAL